MDWPRPDKSTVYRQTFLTFPTIPRPAEQTEQTEQPSTTRAPRSAAAVPAEIWMRILHDLSPITLKSIRLVCRAWANVATPYLFRTAYLDSFEASWTRLQQLSHSPYASLVDTIAWNPLYLSEKCLDAAVWRSRYVNLLGDLSHAEYADLHRVFKNVFRQVNSKTDDKKRLSRDDISFNLAAFVNCRQVAFSDYSDMETKCADPHIRRQVQQDRHLLRQAAVWGLCPSHNPFFGEETRQRASLNSMDNVILLLAKLPSISTFCSTMFHSNELTNPLDQGKALPKIERAHLQTRFHHHTPIDWEYDTSRSVTHALESSIWFLRRFPHLRFLTLHSLYMDPGSGFNEPYRLLYREWIDNVEPHGVLDEGEEQSSDDDVDVNIDDADIRLRGRRLSQIDDKFGCMPTGFERQHLDTLEAELTLGITAMPELEELTLKNVSLNVQSLLGWLANQPQLPGGSVVLHLCGRNILYGFDARTFLRLLRVLNVRLLLNDDDKTLYYETNFCGHTTCFRDAAFEARFDRRCLSFVTEFRTDSNYDIYLGSIVAEEEPRVFSDVVMLEASEPLGPLPAAFVDRPGDVTKHFQQATSVHMMWELCYYYCCLVPIVQDEAQKSPVVFQWLDRLTYHEYERESKKTTAMQNVFVLFEAHATDLECTSPESWEEAAYRAGLMAMQESGLGQPGEQELLALYEDELLRLDVTA